MSDKSIKIGKRIVWWLVGIFGGLLVLLLGGILFITFWLTPDRLSEIVNREASKYLAADVYTHNVRFTIWSSYPHLHIEMDSLKVVSRALDSLPASKRKELPADANLLVKTGKFSGGINIRQLFKNRYMLTDITLDSLDLNLVQVNKSVANYNIVPPSKAEAIPYFSANSISLTNSQPIRYRNIEMGADVVLALDTMSINRQEDSDRYRMSIGADTDITFGGLQLLRDFPVSIDGMADLHFHPFGVSTDNIGVNLGNASGKVSVDMAMDNGVRLNSFNYSIDTFNISELLDMLPPGLVQIPGKLDADLALKATATLTKPYIITDPGYPSAKISIDIPRGDVKYNSSSTGNIHIPDIELKALVDFNGDDPRQSTLSIPRLFIEGYGADLTVDARLSELEPRPTLIADLRGKVEVQKLTNYISMLQGLGLQGTIDVMTAVAMRLSEDTKELQDIRVNGDVKIDNLSATVPGMIKNFSINHADIHIADRDTDIPVQNASQFSNGDMKVNSDIKGLKFAMAQNMVVVNVPVVSVVARIRDILGANPLMKVKAKLENMMAQYNSDSTHLNILGINLDMDVDRRKKPLAVGNYKDYRIWNADAGSTYTPTSQKYIVVNVPQSISSMLTRYAMRLNLTAADGEFLTPSYPVMNRFSNLALTTNGDSLTLQSLQLRSQRSSLWASASVSNLRQFLISATPAPLYVRATVGIDTLQLNQICGTYEHGMTLTQGPDAISKMMADTLPHPGDSTTFLLPRNIMAYVDARLQRVELLDFALTDLGANIGMANGNAAIRNMQFGSNFFTAGGSLDYNTSDIQHMQLGLNLNVGEFDLANLFHTFPLILEKAPMLNQLSGRLSADIAGNMRIYPAMFTDLPSARAKIDIHSSGLELQQNTLIRRIMRLMLIPTSGPLHFDNLNIRGEVRNNLIMIDPFYLDFADYSILLAGLNNFNGDMYYHVGLDKSALPLHFGVNIKGNFDKPHIRFGGVGWKGVNTNGISDGIMEADYINLPTSLRLMMHQFLQKAAAADTTPSTDYVY